MPSAECKQDELKIVKEFNKEQTLAHKTKERDEISKLTGETA